MIILGKDKHFNYTKQIILCLFFNLNLRFHKFIIICMICQQRIMSSNLNYSAMLHDNNLICIPNS